MTMLKDQSLQFFAAAEQEINKVCLFLVHEYNLIFIVRHHAKDNSVSVEPAGGKIDPKANGDMESHQEALIREGEQELGVIVKPLSLLSVEIHPFTGKSVAYYACEHESGTPYNKAQDEHLGIIKIPISATKDYESLKLMAINRAQKIVNEMRGYEELSRPIDFRVPEKPVMHFLRQFIVTSHPTFQNLPDEKLVFPPNPS